MIFGGRKEKGKKTNKKKMENGPGGGETGDDDDDAGAGPVNALGQICFFNCGKSVRPKTFLYQKGKNTFLSGSER